MNDLMIEAMRDWLALAKEADAEADAEIARLSAELAAREWQPIETAPKDGTAFLGFLPQFGGFVADQRVQRCVWTGWGGGCWDCQFEKAGPGPTHWQPLPPPPAIKERS